MSVWDGIVGQNRVVQQLQYAVNHPESLAQSWLIYGDEGSGRAQVARSFAAALECPQGGCGTCHVCREVLDGVHPDVTVVQTQKVTISIEQVREVVQECAVPPTTAPWHVIIVEDFGRMLERTTNVLLKEIEEPPARTIWILCASNAQDTLPTIRSRCRVLTLGLPPVEDVAHYIATQVKLDAQASAMIARIAQGDVELALRYAQHPDMVQSRTRIVNRMLTIRKASEAVLLADEIVSQAAKQAQTETDEQIAAEQREFRRANGLSQTEKIPSKIRSTYNAIGKKDAVKALATRRSRDVLDEFLTTLASVYRDVMVITHSAQQTAPLVNPEFESELQGLATMLSAQDVIARLDAIQTARQRLAANGNTSLVLEALLCNLLP